MYSPVSGEILGVNEALAGKPELVNEDAEGTDGSVAVADRTGRPGVAGSDAARLSGEAIVLCRGTKTWRASSDGAALRRASDGLWRACGIFLSDTRHIVQKDLDVAEYTDPTHNPMIPHVCFNLLSGHRQRDRLPPSCHDALLVRSTTNGESANKLPVP